MNKESGFTLLEVLIALSILGMIMTTAFGALRLGSRSWESGLSKADESSELRSVPAFLSRQFSQIVPLNWEEGAKPGIAFEGKRHGVRFIAPAPQRQVGMGLYEFSLKSEQGENGVNLVLYYQPYLPEAGKFQVSELSSHSILLEGVYDASFSFYGASGKGIPFTWQRDWDRRSGRFPALIRLKIENDQDQRIWPELVVPLRIRPKGA